MSKEDLEDEDVGPPPVFLATICGALGGESASWAEELVVLFLATSREVLFRAKQVLFLAKDTAALPVDLLVRFVIIFGAVKRFDSSSCLSAFASSCS